MRTTSMVLAVAALCLLAAAGGFLVTRSGDDGDTAGDETAEAGGTAADAAGVSTTEQERSTTTERPTTSSTATTTTTTIPADPMNMTVEQARTVLAQSVESDRPEVEALLGSWVPQLSSKNIANRELEDRFGSSYYGDERAILANLQQWKGLFPEALVLYSDAYLSFDLNGYYVVIMPVSYGSGEAARDWCDQQQLPSGRLSADDCFGKFLADYPADPSSCYRSDVGPPRACT